MISSPFVFSRPAVRRRHGVTLLELLVVLLLLTLSALVVLPALSPLPAMTDRDARSQVIASARRSAVRRGESARLRIDADGVWALVAARDGAVLDGGRTAAGPARNVLIDGLGSCFPTARSAEGIAEHVDLLHCRWADADSTLPAAR